MCVFKIKQMSTMSLSMIENALLIRVNHLAKVDKSRIFAPLFKEMKNLRGRKVPSFYTLC